MADETLPCPVCLNNLAHYEDCPMKRARIEEHLEPGPGAILQFQGMPDHLKTCEGLRWRLREAHQNLSGVFYYYLRLVNDQPDDLATYLRCGQEIMDRCGRLLVTSEEGNG